MLSQSNIEQLLLPKLKLLEEDRAIAHQAIKRRSTQSNIFMVTAILSIGIALFIDMIDTDYEAVSTAIYIFVLILCSIALGVYWYGKEDNKKARKKFQKKVKEAVYNEIFNLWNETAQYTPNHHVDPSHFKKSQLSDSFNRYTGDDYCTGTLKDGRRFEFSELNVQRVERASDENTRTIPVFKGLFFVLDNTLPVKDFDGSLMIEPKERQPKKQKKKPKPKSKPSHRYNDNILDADLPSHDPKEEAPKEIEIPLFDQLYEITPSNFATRAKLSNEFCDQIAKMRTQQRQNVSLHFIDNKAYLACKHHLDFWPVQLELSMLSKARVRHVAWSFAVAFGLLEILAASTHADRPSSI